MQVGSIYIGTTGQHHIRRPGWLLVQDRANQVGRSPCTVACWMPSSQQHIKQYAKRIDVGGRCYAFSLQLLRSCVFWSESASTLGSNRGCAGTVFSFQKLGNAEIQKLDLLVASHKHIRGLDVPMHDQIAVSMCY